MPGPYRRLDVPNVNQHVVTASAGKAKKKAAAPAAADVKADPVVDDEPKPEPAQPVTATVKKSTADK